MITSLYVLNNTKLNFNVIWTVIYNTKEKLCNKLYGIVKKKINIQKNDIRARVGIKVEVEVGVRVEVWDSNRDRVSRRGLGSRFKIGSCWF